MTDELTIPLAGPCIMCYTGDHAMCINGTRDRNLAKKFGAKGNAVIRCPCAERDHNEEEASTKA